MAHSTPQRKTVRKEALRFLQIFARTYSPTPDNEEEARRLAQALSIASPSMC